MLNNRYSRTWFWFAVGPSLLNSTFRTFLFLVINGGWLMFWAAVSHSFGLALAIVITWRILRRVTM